MVPVKVRGLLNNASVTHALVLNRGFATGTPLSITRSMTLLSTHSAHATLNFTVGWDAREVTVPGMAAVIQELVDQLDWEETAGKYSRQQHVSLMPSQKCAALHSL